MRRIIPIVLLLACAAESALARLSETPEQCEQRYGKHVREIPGHGLVEYCRVYKKSGINISAVFIKGRSTPKVGCVLYTTHEGGSAYSMTRRLLPDEQQALLATVPGTWTLPRKEPVPTLEGGGRVRELSVKPNAIRDSRSSDGSKAVRSTVDVVYPGTVDAPPAALGRNGMDKYAFTISGGLAITYYKIADALIDWSKAVKSQRAKDRKPAPRDFEGF